MELAATAQPPRRGGSAPAGAAWPQESPALGALAEGMGMVSESRVDSPAGGEGQVTAKAKAWRALPHTFDALALHHDWPRTCEHCGIVVYGPGATHCPQRVLDAIAVAEAERDAALAVLRQLIAADDAITWAYSGDDRRDPFSAEVAAACEAAECAYEVALDAARRLLAEGGATQEEAE